MRLLIALAVLIVALAASPAWCAELGVSDRPSWADEFSGSAGRPPNAHRWHFDVGATGWGNDELERYTRSRSNARLNGRGQLEIVARRRRGGGTRRGDYSSARLTTKGKFAFRYGRVAIRAKVPAGRGLWPAFWMLGTGFPRVDWPFCGEIDVFENIGAEPNRVFGTVHGPGSLSDSGVGGWLDASDSLARSYHVYSATWRADRVVFALDGIAFTTVLRASYPEGQQWVFDRPMFMLLNLAVGGEFPGSPSSQTHFPARLQVDWIRVWE